MAVIDLPEDLLISRMRWEQQNFGIHTSGPFGRQTLNNGVPIWAVSIEVDRMNEYASGRWKATMMKLRGSLNQLAVYDVARPVPLGTLRGNGVPFTLAAPVAQGDVSMQLTAGTSNLLTFPEAFDNAAWAKGNATVTPNQLAAPDGTLTADKVLETTANAIHNTAQNSIVIAANTVHTASIFVKAGERTVVKVRAGQSLTPFNRAFVTVDLVSGAITSSGLGGTTSASFAVTNIGNGWFRVSITCLIDAATTAATVQIWPVVGGADTYTGDGVSGFYVWGAKLEPASTVTDYGFGKTLLQADLLGIGSGTTQQVVILTDDALSFSEGRITVNFEHPLRNGFPAGTEVRWDRPKALFRAQSPRMGWDYESVFASGFALDLLEDPRA